MLTEQAILRTSIAVTIVVAAAALAVGLRIGSSAIMFDGAYGIIDAMMTVLSLIVASVIAASNEADQTGRDFSRRFTFGFWHFEPIVLAINGTLLTGAAIYALFDAVGVILAGGRTLPFDVALVYAGIGSAIDVAMTAWVSRANRRIGSQLVALDAKAWGITAGLGLSLFVAFLVGHLIADTRFVWASPYIDPTALVLICMVVIPVPLRTVRKAIAEILLITPPELKADIDRVAADFIARHGFISFNTYVARSGRGIQIELNVIVPKSLPPRRLEDWDGLRDEIGLALGNDSPDLWLTIVFTTDPGWAW